jgi:hypothetical protein
MGDWLYIASLTDRVLLVNWVASYDCGAKFKDLFRAGPRNLKILPFSFPEESGRVMGTVADIADSMGLSSIEWEQPPGQFLVNDDVFTSDVQAVLTAYDGVIALTGVQCVNYFLAHSHFLSSLVPNQDIVEDVNAIKANYFEGNIVIGVHYRAHNSSQDWDVVPPQAGGTRAMPFGEGASPERFIEEMEKVQRRFTRTLSNGEKQVGCRFFIASNSEEAKAKFIQRFSRSIALTGEVDRMQQEGLRFALVEWLLLSECSFILNTYGSSFAVEAAQKNLIPIAGIWGPHVIHHSSVHLPFCGHPQFLKAYGGKEQRMQASTYVEGTVDNRTAMATTIVVKPCNNLAEWGLPHALCTMTDSEAAQSPDIDDLQPQVAS